MKTILTSIAASSLLAALAIAQPLPRYTVTDLGTFGGTYSYAYGINNAGWVAGGAATPTQTNGLAQTAFVWHGFGPLIDLGTLDGQKCPACSSEGAAPNLLGEVAVISETSKTDPNDEDFCGFGTHRQCLAAVWKNWRLTPLPTLKGGNNAQTYWINNRGQVVGVAENGTSDNCATATPFQVLQFEAVIWEANGEIRELPHLPGDTVAFGFGINDKGQAVGVSGLCSNTSAPPVSPFSGAPHGVFWDSDGSVINVGSLGGTPPFNVPSTINNRGEVGGISRSSKDEKLHPFLWTKKTGMQDLGTFHGNPVTGIACCNTLNNSGDAVGVTADTSGNMTAILWHDNVFTDLNTLVSADSPLYLQGSSSINDSRQIVGNGIVKSSCPPTTPPALPAWQANQGACTVFHAFLATPR